MLLKWIHLKFEGYIKVLKSCLLLPKNLDNSNNVFKQKYHWWNLLKGIKSTPRPLLFSWLAVSLKGSGNRRLSVHCHYIPDPHLGLSLPVHCPLFCPGTGVKRDTTQICSQKGVPSLGITQASTKPVLVIPSPHAINFCTFQRFWD